MRFSLNKLFHILRREKKIYRRDHRTMSKYDLKLIEEELSKSRKPSKQR